MITLQNGDGPRSKKLCNFLVKTENFNIVAQSVFSSTSFVSQLFSKKAAKEGKNSKSHRLKIHNKFVY